jgi:hypothetical protein
LAYGYAVTMEKEICIVKALCNNNDYGRESGGEEKKRMDDL